MTTATALTTLRRVTEAMLGRSAFLATTGGTTTRRASVMAQTTRPRCMECGTNIRGQVHNHICGEDLFIG